MKNERFCDKKAAVVSRMSRRIWVTVIIGESLMIAIIAVLFSDAETTHIRYSHD